MQREIEKFSSLSATETSDDKAVLAPMRVGVLTSLGAGLGIGGAGLTWLTERMHLWLGWALSGCGMIVGGLICLAIASGYYQSDREGRASRRDNTFPLVVAIAAALWLVGRYLL